MSLTEPILPAAGRAVADPAHTRREGRNPAYASGDPFSVLVGHLRAHPRVDAAVFLVTDARRREPEPYASWFASPVLREALLAALDRPYDRNRPGLTEASLERDRPLFLPRVDAWESAPVLYGQLRRTLGPSRAGQAWAALRGASVIACPVRATLSRTTGVLIAVSSDPARALRRPDLDTVGVLADLAGLARERSDMLAAEATRTREELLLKQAAEGTAGSLETSDVEQQTVDHALRLVAGDHARLTVVAPRSNRLTSAAVAGVEIPAGVGGFDAATLSEVVRSGNTAQVGGPVYAVHVPAGIGARVYAVLSVVRLGERFAAREVELVQTMARMAAAAMANALDFQRERGVARALTRGFIPASPPEAEGFEMSFLYEPADNQPVGGDLYGSWRLPGGEVAVLVGDVAGKGVQSAALSAMTRFFIEARSWDCTDPGQALAEVGTMLFGRLPDETFVTAAFGLLDDEGSLRYANAGHLRPLVLRAGGELFEARGSGLPLGVSEMPAYECHTLRLDAGDLVVGFTDGVAEARRDGELLGEDRLRAIVRRAAGRAQDVQGVVRGVHHEVRGWAGGLSDDVVIVGLKRRTAARQGAVGAREGGASAQPA